MTKNITQADLDAVATAIRAEVGGQIGALTESVEGLKAVLERASAQFATPAQVVTAITDAPSAKASTRKAKAPAKTTAKASTTKAKPAITLVSTDEAAKLVAEGADPWKVFVPSTNPERLGEPVPFFRVQRAEAVKAGTVKARTANREENATLAKWLRDRDLPANGAVWASAKSGVRNVAKLRGIAKTEAANNS